MLFLHSKLAQEKRFTSCQDCFTRCCFLAPTCDRPSLTPAPFWNPLQCCSRGSGLPWLRILPQADAAEAAVQGAPGSCFGYGTSSARRGTSCTSAWGRGPDSDEASLRGRLGLGREKPGLSTQG